MIAAVWDRIAPTVARLAPAAVDVRATGEGAAALAGAQLVVPSNGATVDALAQLHSLRVVQTVSAGTEWIEDRVPPWATLCNARGAHDVPVAEWVVAALLGAGTQLLRAARERTWWDGEVDELQGSTVLVVGFGSIGRAVRDRLVPFGVTVVGVARTAREEDGSRVHAVDELPDLLPRADAVVVLAPLTDATRGMVDAAFLARMRDGALFVNAGRGALTDTDALLAEASTARLRIVLDVVDPEPLPGDHPLWSAPGVLAITPHLAGGSPESFERVAELTAEQLRRMLAGEPLLNVVQAAAR